MVIANTFITRYVDYLTEALLFCTCLVTAFLWVSALNVDKGMGMAVFGLIAISISGGYYNLCIDGFLTKNLPKDMASIGSALSMSIKGVACIIFPIVNGFIMGAKADQASMSSCCMFMAVPSSVGCIFTWWFYFQNRADIKRKKEAKTQETLNMVATLIGKIKLTPGQKMEKHASEKVIHNDH